MDGTRYVSGWSQRGHGRSARVEITLASTWSERRTITWLLPQRHSPPERHFLVAFVLPSWVHQVGHTAEHGMRQEAPEEQRGGLWWRQDWNLPSEGNIRRHFHGPPCWITQGNTQEL